jgi:polysaccharide biosynthesis protein PslE
MNERDGQYVDYSNSREILNIVFKHKYTILGVFFILFAVSIWYSTRIHPIYEAKSVVLIKLGREFQQRPEDGGKGYSLPVDAISKSELQILSSRDLLSKVVRAIGPGQFRQPWETVRPEGVKSDTMEEALESFEDRLKITPAGANLIQILFSHSDPKTAAEVVNALVDAFKERHLEVFGGNGTDFLEVQERTYREKLKASEDRLRNLKERTGIYSPTKQKDTLIQQIGTADASLKTVQSEISEQQDRIALMQSPKWAVDLPAETRNRLDTLRQREREVLEKYTETSSVVRSLRREIKIAEDSIAEASERSRQMDLDRSGNDLRLKMAKAENLRQQLQQLRSDVRALDNGEFSYLNLQRELADQEQSYRTYSAKLQESLIQDDMDRRKMVAISVIERATPSILPKKARYGRKEVVAAGFLGGIALGVLFAFLLEFFSSAMTTPMIAEKRLNLPVLVAIARR